jgi:hypothetical protein
MSTAGLLYLVAALLLFGVGVAHSFLGERYILIRLFRRNNLPKLFGGTEFTVRTLRFAWHLTTIAWWGAAALFFAMARWPITLGLVSSILGITFLITALITFVVSRGRHLAWPVFLIISLIAFYGARA